ncbi:MAG: CDP-glycerol glycerophosphotransferase family protein [Lachnospiraceae bacterium]|nr:CDP-glycerol glycerophosphotransferase family protein [Lachnospiraceae bacterium]
MEKENKLKKTIEVIYRQKIDNFFAKVINLFTKHRPLKDVILLESHNDFDCNGGALYDYLIAHHYNDRLKIVWLLKNPAPKHLPKNVKAYRLYRPSIMKSYYRCVARIIAADDYMTQKKRPDQKEYYLTHGGITFKNVKGLIVVQDHVDYVLSPSRNYDPYICANYSVKDPERRMLHLGYPSNDRLFQDQAAEISKITKQKYDRVVLWLPTFRTSKKIHRTDSAAGSPLGIPLIEDLPMYARLNDYLAAHRALLIIKIHPVQDLSLLRITDMSNIKVLTPSLAKSLSVDLYRLMACCDACVSDYSSAAYQYLLLNRPIGFVLSDLPDYKLGFSVSNYEDFLPGEHIYAFDDLLAFLSQVVEGEGAGEGAGSEMTEDSGAGAAGEGAAATSAEGTDRGDPWRARRTALLDFLYEYQDGNACRRLVEFMGLDSWGK